jgi:hypothetical protein
MAKLESGRKIILVVNVKNIGRRCCFCRFSYLNVIWGISRYQDGKQLEVISKLH